MLLEISREHSVKYLEAYTNMGGVGHDAAVKDGTLLAIRFHQQAVQLLSHSSEQPVILQ